VSHAKLHRHARPPRGLSDRVARFQPAADRLGRGLSGTPSVRAAAAPGTRRENKANLFAAIGPDAPGGVVLSGHTDVVPVDDQDWHTDPFELTERDGLLYGRGSADMKGFSAVFLSRLASAGSAAWKPLYLALSYDEEVGCLGIDRMVDDALARFARPDYAIIGEPTSMRIVRAHKSINVFRTVVTGRRPTPASPIAAPAPSSPPRASSSTSMRWVGASAPQPATRAASRRGPRCRSVRSRAARPSTSCPPLRVSLGVPRPAGRGSRADHRGHAGFIERRGAARPARVRARSFGRDHAHCARAAAGAGPGSEGRTLGARDLRGVRDGGSGEVSFATEAGSFQRAGISSVVCGPGSIDQAHQPNEFIDPAELSAARP
jgi:acetylornithine deacetylase